ncbi:MAG: hypothetical protein GY797_05955 [Deltaproteobacteria bacterium]|nr:hypothetical protein [Deltaproteobacteria bacterium]
MEPSSPDVNQLHITRRLLVLALAISSLMTVWVLNSYLWDEYRVVNDTQNFYWMARAQDPSLFPIDYLYIAGNYILELDISGFHFLLHRRGLGYSSLFFLAGTLLDYVWLTKLAGLTLMTLCVFYLYKIGEYLRDGWAGLSLSLMFVFFNLASPLSLSMFSGLQRGFALPVFIIFLYYLIRQKYVWAALLIFIAALVYLPNLPPMILTYGLALLSFKQPFKVSARLNWGNVLPLAIALLLSAGVLVLAFFGKLGLLPPSPPVFPDRIGPTLPSIAEHPSFQAGGSMPLYTSFPLLGRVGVFDTGGDVTNFIVMLVLVFLIYKAVGHSTLKQMPKEVWYLALAGITMFFVSLFFVMGLLSLALYLPSRYTRSTLFLAAIFFIGLNWMAFLQKLPGWILKKRNQLIFFAVTFCVAMGMVYLFFPNRPLLIPIFWLLGVMISGVVVLLAGSSLFWIAGGYSPLKGPAKWAAVILIGGVMLFLGTIYTNILGLKTTNPSRAEREVYQYLASLPKEVMVAGDPQVMTNVPLFSKRSVLFRALFPKFRAPITEYFDAQYGESLQPMLEFCQRYQVDYVVLNQDEFTPGYLNRKDFFYQPWNDQIVTKVAGRTDFALLQAEPVFASDPFMVIKCDAETLTPRD